MLRLLNQALSPGGARGRLAILIFHRVLREPDPLLPSEPDAAWFEALMSDMRRWFNVIPLEEGARRLAARDLPPRALAVTFDDGYADNHDVALPILDRLGLHATFFIATGFLGGGIMWNDRVIEAIRLAQGTTIDLQALNCGVIPIGSAAERRVAIDRVLAALKYRAPSDRLSAVDMLCAIARAAPRADLMMTRAQVKRLVSAGMGIGAHTRHHPILTTLDARAARDEIAAGKADLEKIAERPVRLFAYPNGRPGTDYGAAHVELVRELGFTAACSTAPGIAASGDDVHQLPRMSTWDRVRWRNGLRLSKHLWRSQHARA